MHFPIFRLFPNRASARVWTIYSSVSIQSGSFVCINLFGARYISVRNSGVSFFSFFVRFFFQPPLHVFVVFMRFGLHVWPSVQLFSLGSDVVRFIWDSLVVCVRKTSTNKHHNIWPFGRPFMLFCEKFQVNGTALHCYCTQEASRWSSKFR